MNSSDGRESCGRCSFSTIVDAVESADTEPARDAPPDSSAREPYAGARIELDERDLRLANAPAILAGRLKRRLDDAVHRIVYE